MFQLSSEYSPRGDQPQAIATLTGLVREGRRHMVLRGVTGSGKTYSIANVVASVDRPTLVISPNKTLAAQLFSEFRAFFPSNAVEYFVSYYDYYQPEAYIPQSDTYIEKDALINDEIDRMRHSATKSLLERRDVLVVASVSCIYGIGEPDTYQGLHLELGEGERIDRDEIIRRLVAVQYERNDYDFHRGTFRVRGDVVEVFPANEESIALRIELFGDVIDALSRIDPLRGAVLERIDRVHIYPASHYVTEASQLERAFSTIQEELGETAGVPAPEEPPARGATARAADPLRHGDAARARLLSRHRELLAPPDRAPPGRGSADPDRLPAEGRADRHRREPRRRAADPRHVLRRPLAQGGPRRVRVPDALRVRQPTAHVRRVHAAHGSDDLRLCDPGGLRARPRAPTRSPSR